MSVHFHTRKEKKKEKLPEIKKQKKKKVQWIHCIYIVIIVFRNNVIKTPCKGIWIPESGKFWLVESGILENFVRNPESQDVKSIIQDCLRFPLHDAIIANKEDLV